jgi:hypothetical protein
MVRHLSFRRTAACRALMILGTFFLASAGRESNGQTQTVPLTVSNMLPAETTPPYATVTLTQTVPNTVELTVTPTTNWYQSEGANFGVGGFAFNTDLTLQGTDIKFNPPSSGFRWSFAQNKAADGFGTFNWVLSSSAGRPVNPLVIDVTHTGATPAHFMFFNTQNAEFTANIVNFTVAQPGVTSHWVVNSGIIHFFKLQFMLYCSVGALILILLAIVIFLRKRRKSLNKVS